MKNSIIIKKYDKLFLAEMIVQFLNDNNINAVILNQKDSSFNTFGNIEVMIPREEEKKAKELLKEWENAEIIDNIFNETEKQQHISETKKSNDKIKIKIEKHDFEEWKIARTFGKIYLAQLAIQTLKKNNINAVLVNKKENITKSMGEIELFVQEKNLEKAKNIIQKI